MRMTATFEPGVIAVSGRPGSICAASSARDMLRFGLSVGGGMSGTGFFASAVAAAERREGERGRSRERAARESRHEVPCSFVWWGLAAGVSGRSVPALETHRSRRSCAA